MQPAVAVAGGVGKIRKRAVRLGSAAFQWWITELAGMLPKHLAKYLQRTRPPACLLFFNQDGLSFHWADRGRQSTQPLSLGAQLPKAISNATRRGSIPVRLDQELALAASVKLPAQAEANLDQILHHHVGLLVPLAPEEVSYRYAVTARDVNQNTISMNITIVKRQTLAALHDQCDFFGLHPESIHIDGDTQQFDFVGLTPASSKSHVRLLRRASGLAAAVMTLLALCALQWKAMVQRRVLDAELTHVALQASAAEGIKRRIKELADRSDFINGHLRRVPRADLLNELTLRLPNGAWLTEVHIEDDTLTMSGNATFATTLIQVLEASPLLANPHFVAPIVAGEGGYEHFEIALAIRSQG